MDDLIDRAMGALVAEDPRRAAEITLTLLLTHLRAPAGCVYRCVGTALDLWVSHGIDQRDLARVNETWADARESILAGHTYSEDRFALMPVANGHTLGVIYVGAQRPLAVDVATTSALIPLFKDALRAPDLRVASPFDDFLETATVEQLERQKLVLALERHEHNVSRVAREYEVERGTIYNWMRRLGIERQRVPRAKGRRFARASR